MLVIIFFKKLLTKIIREIIVLYWLQKKKKTEVIFKNQYTQKFSDPEAFQNSNFSDDY